MTSHFDSQRVRRAFAAAAGSYARHAALQGEIQARLMEVLDWVQRPPARILDVGSGPGSAARALKKRWPKAEVIALDLALPMLQQARRQAGRWRPAHACVCADARQLPFADGSFDLVFSNLCMQWIDDLPALFTCWRRVLVPGGFLACSSFGPATLHELRTTFAAVDHAPHVSRFAPIQHIGDSLMQAGFRDPVLDTDHFTLTYANVTELMQDLRGLGAGNADSARRRSLTGKQRMAAAIAAYEPFRQPDGRIPASYEAVYAHALAPAPGQPLRENGHDLIQVPLSTIPIRRKTPPT